MKVLVYDDVPEIANELAGRVRKACKTADVFPVTQEEFQESIEVVNHRRAVWRGDSTVSMPTESTPVDEADVVVVDYDLLRYSEAGDTTGSRLAYLLRCFTKCGLVIVLNEYGNNSFDVSLRNPSLDFADLHLGDRQVGNPGLWTETFEGYRPWHWPVLPKAVDDFEKCVEDIQENLDQPILDFLELERFVDWMPARAQEMFFGSGDMDSVRFNIFVEQARGGIETKDNVPADYMARVAAGRLIGLLNGLILSEQSLLVDAPHLVSRFPSLMKDGSQDINYWNRLCDPVIEEVDDLLDEHLRQYRFKHQHWVWRPVWYWPDIAKDGDISEVRDPWAVNESEWVFCENVSRFVPTEFADDFRADVRPPFNKRFVLKRKSPEVASVVDMVGSGGPLDPLEVEYIPQAAFSL